MPIRKLKKLGAMRLMKEEHPVAAENLMFFLNNLYPLTDKFKELITPMLRTFIAGKCFEFARAGEEITTALWIERGYVRLYKKRIDENGAAVDETIDFGIPQRILWAPECFFNGKKSTYNIDIAKGTVVIPFTRNFYNELKISVPEIERLGNLILAIGCLAEKERSEMMRMNGEDRYNRFLELYGEQINHFYKQKQFASLLGITPVYLSKLRKRRNRKKQV